MRVRPIQVYVSLMALLALGVLATLDWGSIRGMAVDEKLGFSILLGMALISESRTLSIAVGKKSGNTSSIVFLPLLTSIILFGPVPSVALMGVTGVCGEFIIRKKELIRATFNSAQYIVSTAVAGAVFLASGGVPLASQSGPSLAGPLGERVLPVLLPFFAFGFLFLLLNNTSVAVAISLSEGGRLRMIWSRLVGKSGTNLFYDLLVSPVAIFAALAYLAFPPGGILFILFPLYFIRQAYQTILELQQANRDLLSALVKAIETRDPYTHGHSIRVQSLAGRIGEAMGFSPRRQDDLQNAALLHDIGKIEAGYSDILRKGSDLTEEERHVIESHVLKGVEILQQLSSFPRNVVEAVKGHHERVDGKGYPLGLRGDEIPLAARIIKVCDAIDAMLSDRPYRKALSLEQVREQLVIYGGSQFDRDVVKVAIEGNLLEVHQAEIFMQKRAGIQEGTSASPPTRKRPQEA